MFHSFVCICIILCSGLSEREETCIKACSESGAVCRVVFVWEAGDGQSVAKFVEVTFF